MGRLYSAQVVFPSAATLAAALALSACDAAPATPDYTLVCVQEQTWLREDDTDCEGGHGGGYVHMWIPHHHYVPPVGSAVDRHGGYHVRPGAGASIGRAPVAGRPPGTVKTGVVGNGGPDGSYGGSGGG